ncbi:MAG TPA: glycosyltransferase family 39 protein [Acidimicrobiales bacterium]|nr:glycosyltransferase family 39 protein [Acidimicrobiales bacterium]
MTLTPSRPHGLQTTEDWRGGVRLLALCALLSLALHLPGLVRPLFDADEATVATVARAMNAGAELYHETADRKPPVVPYIYAGVFRLAGDGDLRPVRAAAALALAATAVLLAREARRRYGDPASGTWCAVLFLLATVSFFPSDVQAAGFEGFMLLPMTAAVVSAGRGKAVQAGLWLALACLTKQTAITAALPMSYLLVRAGGWRAVARAAVAAVVPVAGTAVAFGPSEFLRWNVTGNAGYLRVGDSLDHAFLRGLGMTSAFIAFNGVLVLSAVRAARRGKLTTDLWLWIAGAVLSVAAGLRFYGHYYLQLLPPLALAAAPIVAEARRRWRSLATLAVVPAVALVVAAFLPFGTRNVVHYREVAALIRATTDTDDTIFVWGTYPELYWAGGRLPGTRFVHTGFLTGNTGGRRPGSGRAEDGIPGAWKMLFADFSADRPDLVVDASLTTIRNARHYPLMDSPLAAVIRGEYVHTQTVRGVAFYRRVAADP